MPWRRAAAPSAIWPVRRRLVRDPDVCAGHDTVGLMAQELAAWHAMLAKMRQFAAELAVSPAVRTVGIWVSSPGPDAAPAVTSSGRLLTLGSLGSHG